MNDCKGETPNNHSLSFITYKDKFIFYLQLAQIINISPANCLTYKILILISKK